jgi:hypothetical protein
MPLIARERHNPLVFNSETRSPRAMDEAATDPDRGSLTAVSMSIPGPVLAALTAAGRAALDEAAALARQASAPATLRAYRSDWAHYAAWCERMGFVPVPAAPAVVGAYLASLTWQGIVTLTILATNISNLSFAIAGKETDSSEVSPRRDRKPTPIRVRAPPHEHMRFWHCRPSVRADR